MLYMHILVALHCGYENMWKVTADGERVTITHYADGRGNIPRIHTRACVYTACKMHARIASVVASNQAFFGGIRPCFEPIARRTGVIEWQCVTKVRPGAVVPRFGEST